MEEFNTFEELAQYTKDKKLEGVIYDGFVYSVKGFKMEHPGGKKIIENELNTDIEEVFKEADHSKNALKLMKTLPIIGKMKLDSKKETEDGEEALDDKYTEDAIDVEENKILKAFCCSRRQIIKKLVTKEDPIYLHKTLGFFALCSFTYRYGYV